MKLVSLKTPPKFGGVFFIVEGKTKNVYQEDEMNKAMVALEIANRCIRLFVPQGVDRIQ